MKQVSKNYRGFIIALMFVATLGLTLPSASAMNTPDFSKTGNIILNQVIEITYTGNAADDPHSVLVTQIAKPTAPTGAKADPAVNTQSCRDTSPGLNPAAGDAAVFELRNAAGTDASEIRDIDDGETITIPFGVTDTVLATVSSTVDVNGVAVTDTTFTAKWVQITGGVTGSALAKLDITGAWTWQSCGYDTTDGAPNGDLAWSHDESFLVSEPIGGEILPINSVSLVVAGLAANTMLLIPVIGAMAGAGFAILRLHKKD